MDTNYFATWMHNDCIEMLAQFPPATVQDLVDGYQERSTALLQLIALPLISSAAINYMRSLQLDDFLSLQSWNLTICMQFLLHENILEVKVVCSFCYFIFSGTKAHKFVVGSLVHIVANMKIPDSSMPEMKLPWHLLNCSPSILLFFNAIFVEPLWAFCTVSFPRPTEFLRLVGNTDVTSESNAFHHKETEIFPVADAPGIHGSGKENHARSTEAVIITDRFKWC